MKTMASLALAVAIGFAAAPGLSAADGKRNPAPAYDPSTEANVEVTITEVRETPKTEPLGGVHLMVKTKSDTVDVYVAPADFLKIFDIVFKAGEQIQVTGSKVKLGDADVVLAREIQIGQTTLLLRDKNGAPYWQTSKEPLPTGY